MDIPHFVYPFIVHSAFPFKQIARLFLIKPWPPTTCQTHSYLRRPDSFPDGNMDILNLFWKIINCVSVQIGCEASPCFIFFLRFYLFVHKRQRERGRSRLHARSLMWVLIPGHRDHALGWRGRWYANHRYVDFKMLAKYLHRNVQEAVREIEGNNSKTRLETEIKPIDKGVDSWIGVYGCVHQGKESERRTEAKD